jgi:hypothetical protein
MERTKEPQELGKEALKCYMRENQIQEILNGDPPK